MELIPNIRIWLSTSDNRNVIGGGRYRLLQAIDEHGSLSTAAKHLDISYRKAWGDLKKAEASAGFKLIVKNRGGSGGGKTVLTPDGEKLLKAYREFSDDVRQFAADLYSRRSSDFSGGTDA